MRTISPAEATKMNNPRRVHAASSSLTARVIRGGGRIAFVPAAVIGLLLEPLRERLYGIWPIVGAWIVGGLLILLLVEETVLFLGWPRVFIWRRGSLEKLLLPSCCAGPTFEFKVFDRVRLRLC